MEQEIKWVVTLGADEDHVVHVYLNGEVIGPPVNTVFGGMLVNFLRLAGEDITNVISKELGA